MSVKCGKIRACVVDTFVLLLFFLLLGVLSCVCARVCV
uniref:Uncharacterized protein n=1 Tax=Rhizophora mucronata TaxID=61149 RepID=A0A2P2QJC4_RHIMU